MFSLDIIKKTLMMMIFFICLFKVKKTSAGMFNSKGDVKAYNVKSFKSHLGKSSKGTMVVFYSPRCGHCRSLQPDYEKAATNLKNLVNFIAIDCESQENSASCGSEYQIRGYPTIKYYSANPISIDYQGQRTSSALIEFSTKNMPSFTKRVKTFDQLESLIDKSSSDKPLVVLFTKSSSATPLFKALSSVIHKKMDVYISSTSA
ncbi:thioredoxin-like protein [Phakopsora pachyrhizi]|nr:thioredoxin-like protein [Phakopsora pachyrhizi]